MFKDVVLFPKKIEYLGSHSFNLPVPVMKDVTFFSVVLALHDGTFFADWWIWINDIVSIFLILLSITGVIRWIKRKKSFLFNLTYIKHLIYILMNKYYIKGK